MMPRLRRLSPFALCLTLAAIASGCSSHSNGYASREMEGVEGIEVVSANVRVDLRPLADKAPSVIHSTYRLKNPGPAKEVNFFLLCLTPKEVNARLNDVALVVESRTPASEKGWPKDITSVTKPTTTPRPSGENPLAYDWLSESTSAGALINVTLPPGESVLRLSHSCPPTRYVTDNPTIIWQCVHYFKPSSKWSKFGPLVLVVEYPPGWEITDSFGMERVGDRLEKTFEQRPTEPLLISTRFQPDKDKWRLYQSLDLVLAAIVIFAIFLMGRSSARRQARWELRESDDSPHDAHLAIVLLLSPLATAVAVWWSLKGSYLFLVPEGQRSRDFESATGFSLCCAGPPAVVIGFLGGWCLYWLVRKLFYESIMRAAPPERWHDDDYDDDWDRPRSRR